MTEAYGKRLGERFRVENAPAIVSRALRTGNMAVTEVRCDNPLPEMSNSIQQEDAFLVALQLRDVPNREYWEDGRRASVCDLRAGESSLHDLKREPRGRLDKPYHTLAFYMPRAALDAIADEANATRIRDLSYKPGAGVNDVTISSLGRLMLPALRDPDQANQLFVDHLMLALGVHIAQTYGGMQPVSRPIRGRLAPWQERRAKEILRANLRGGVPLKEVAQECGLPEAHFLRAFRRTLGVTPHDWLIEQRIVLSEEKLRDDRLPLTDVAAECDFCDQSHFERKRAEEAFREAQMELAHANRVVTMGQLTASIVHEVKQPLAAAAADGKAGLNWLTRSDPEIEEAKECVESSLKSIDRAVQIIERIHQLARKTSPGKQRLEVNEAIVEAIELVRGEILKNGVTIRTELADCLPPIHGDRVQFQQVILNLMINSVQAMSNVNDGKRELAVATGLLKPGGSVQVTVRDSGPGLSVENIERLFQPFYTTKPDGMGMGLSICRKIIEDHGGRLWASANVPCGAMFQLALPPIANTAS